MLPCRTSPGRDSGHCRFLMEMVVRFILQTLISSGSAPDRDSCFVAGQFADNWLAIHVFWHTFGSKSKLVRGCCTV